MLAGTICGILKCKPLKRDLLKRDCCMHNIREFFDSISSVLKTVGIADIVDILIVAYLIYKAVQIIKETRAAQLLKGIGLILGAYVLADILQLKTLNFLLQNLLQIGLFAILVVFQPELRRILEQIGNSQVLKKFQFFKETEDIKKVKQVRNNIVTVANAVQELSEDKTGALIVIEKQTKLGEIANTGVLMRAKISKELICNIFFHNSPLHDGAMIIRDHQIYAAGCFLPLSANFTISKDLGTRHRAALGVSENSDCVVIVVSEETGNISFTKKGVLQQDLHKDDLVNILFEELVPRNPYTEEELDKEEVEEPEENTEQLLDYDDEDEIDRDETE